MLLTDTNILQRVSRGRAMQRVERLRRREVRLATTEHNALELRRNLTVQLGLTDGDAAEELQRVLAPFELILAEDYAYRRDDADQRLREGGRGDWPLLAAALALDAHIWSDDTDFFGVGVPIWSTDNVHLRDPEREGYHG